MRARATMNFGFASWATVHRGRTLLKRVPAWRQRGDPDPSLMAARDRLVACPEGIA